MKKLLNKKRFIYLIFGKTGSGKTFYVKKLIKNFKRVIILEPSLDEYDNEGIIFYDFLSLITYIKQYNVNLTTNFIFVCKFTNDEDVEKLFILCERLKNLVLILEECEIFISPYNKSSNFLRLVRYGRHYNISIIGIARRLSELSLDFRAQVNKIISFIQTDNRDVQNMVKLGYEFQNLPSLKNYEFIEKDF